MISSALKRHSNICRAYKSLLWSSLLIRFQIYWDVLLSFLLERAKFVFPWGSKLAELPNSWTVECIWPPMKLVPSPQAPRPASLPGLTSKGLGASLRHLRHQGWEMKEAFEKRLEVWLIWNSSKEEFLQPRDRLQKNERQCPTMIRGSNTSTGLWGVQIMFSVTY